MVEDRRPSCLANKDFDPLRFCWDTTRNVDGKVAQSQFLICRSWAVHRVFGKLKRVFGKVGKGFRKSEETRRLGNSSHVSVAPRLLGIPPSLACAPLPHALTTTPPR